jgi:hypothetical protein
VQHEIEDIYGNAWGMLCSQSDWGSGCLSNVSTLKKITLKLVRIQLGGSTLSQEFWGCNSMSVPAFYMFWGHIRSSSKTINDECVDLVTWGSRASMKAGASEFDDDKTEPDFWSLLTDFDVLGGVQLDSFVVLL